jgi:feruloyl-CoA synthase
MTWAAHYAGVPVAPISPAYSLADGPLGRLVAASRVVDPWVVFVQDARRFARAIEAIGVPHSRVIAVDHASQTCGVCHALARKADPRWTLRSRAETPTGRPSMFTSGSTGYQGVVVTHGMLTAAVRRRAGVRQQPSDPMTQVDWLPWHHTMVAMSSWTLLFSGTLYRSGQAGAWTLRTALANLRDVAPTFCSMFRRGTCWSRSSNIVTARHVFSRLEYA